MIIWQLSKINSALKFSHPRIERLTVSKKYSSFEE